MHVGVCPLAKSGPSSSSEERLRVISTEEKGGSTPPRPATIEDVKAEIAAIEAGKPKRDRAAYMREYRKRP